MTDKPTRGLRHNSGKPRVDLVPSVAVLAIAEVFRLGLIKYPPRNWELGMPFSEVLASMERHLLDLKAGYRNDAEDGLPQSWKILTNAAILAFYELYRVEFDDLPKLDGKTLIEEMRKLCKPANTVLDTAEKSSGDLSGTDKINDVLDSAIQQIRVGGIEKTGPNSSRAVTRTYDIRGDLNGKHTITENLEVVDNLDNYFKMIEEKKRKRLNSTDDDNWVI